MNIKDFTTLVIRLALGLIFITAGFSKLVPDYIGNIIGPVNIEMFSTSKEFYFFMIFVAIYQILAGAIILSQRYSVLGLILLFPLAVGILIFTIIADFGGTPFINLFILLLLVYAIIQEKKSVIQILKLDFSGITQSQTYLLYPNKMMPNIALSIAFLTMALSFLNNPILNGLLSIALLLFTINLFQVRNYLVIDNLILGLFFVIGFIIINGLFLNQIIPKAFLVVFPLILVGFSLYFLRLIYYKFSSKH